MHKKGRRAQVIFPVEESSLHVAARSTYYFKFQNTDRMQQNRYARFCLLLNRMTSCVSRYLSPRNGSPV